MVFRGIQLSASMLCADLGNLKRDIQQINLSGVDLMHVDLMDGHFVPNMTGGRDYADCIREYSEAPCDFHLMTIDPLRLIKNLGLKERERAAFHIEAVKNPYKLICIIKEYGALAGIALNPGTPVSKVIPFLPDIDYLLVLIVNPGFKGQPIIPEVLDKLRRLVEIRNRQNLNFRFLIDGAVTPENIIEIVESGADDIVCGPFTCFNQALGGIEPTLSLVKTILSDHGYDSNLKKRGGVQA